MLSTGDILKGHYSILKKSEQGEYGKIYKAYDVEAKVLVAVKEIEIKKDSPEQDKKTVALFYKEFEFLKEHPNKYLVKFIDVFEHSKKYYYVTEWIEGINLEDILKARGAPFKGKEVLSLYYALVDFVSFYQTSQYNYNLHFLRPSDIVIDKEGRAKIVDVGLAMNFGSCESPNGYLIPDEDYDEKRDVYFIGSIIYELLTNIKPGTKPLGKLPSVDSINKDIPKSLAKIVTLSIAPRKERYNVVRDIKSNLLEYFPEYSDVSFVSGEKNLEERLQEKENMVTIGKISCLVVFFIVAFIALGIWYYSAEIHNRYELYLLEGCKENLRTIGNALENYKKENYHYPDKLTKLVPNYLKEIPTCPSSKDSRGYIDSYKAYDLGKKYKIFCKGGHHRKIGVLENYPQFSSKRGIILKINSTISKRKNRK